MDDQLFCLVCNTTSINLETDGYICAACRASIPDWDELQASAILIVPCSGKRKLDDFSGVTSTPLTGWTSAAELSPEDEE